MGRSTPRRARPWLLLAHGVLGLALAFASGWVARAVYFHNDYPESWGESLSYTLGDDRQHFLVDMLCAPGRTKYRVEEGWSSAAASPTTLDQRLTQIIGSTEDEAEPDPELLERYGRDTPEWVILPDSNNGTYAAITTAYGWPIPCLIEAVDNPDLTTAERLWLWTPGTDTTGSELRRPLKAPREFGFPIRPLWGVLALNAAIYAACSLTLFTALRRARRVVRRRRNRCPNCGYAITDLPEPICPECGTGVSARTAEFATFGDEGQPDPPLPSPTSRPRWLRPRFRPFRLLFHLSFGLLATIAASWGVRHMHYANSYPTTWMSPGPSVTIRGDNPLRAESDHGFGRHFYQLTRAGLPTLDSVESSIREQLKDLAGIRERFERLPARDDVLLRLDELELELREQLTAVSSRPSGIPAWVTPIDPDRGITTRYSTGYGWPLPGLAEDIINPGSAGQRRAWIWTPGLDGTEGLRRERPVISPHEFGFPIRPIWPGTALDIAFYALLSWLPFAAFVAVRRFRRARRGHCPDCGYDINGLPPEAPCPECGCRDVRVSDPA